MKLKDYFKHEGLDTGALQQLARERFQGRDIHIAAGVLSLLHTDFRTGSKYLVAKARLMDDLGFDDMDFIGMLRGIEKKFSIQFGAEDFRQDSTIDDLIKVTEGKSVQKKQFKATAS